MAGMIRGAQLPFETNSSNPFATGGSNTGGRPLTTLYNTAATQQAGDYDSIMSGYDELLGAAKNRMANTTPLNYNPISPSFQNYQPNFQYNRSSDLNSAIGGLQNYANTGGYSDSDINSIRERGLSPIRSIYSSANEAAKRQKSIQGGYSPNFGAVQAKLARQLGGQIGEATTRVNADIAQMVAQGKLAGYQALSPLVSQDNALENQYRNQNETARVDAERFNAEEASRVAQLNATMQAQFDEINNRNKQAAFDDQARALAGKASLYGTTPALTSLFGQQALQDNSQRLQAVSTANAIKNQRANLGLQIAESGALY